MNNRYVKVERKRQSENDFTDWGSMSGQTSCSNEDTHHLMFGIYSQTKEVKDMTMFISNLTIN